MFDLIRHQTVSTSFRWRCCISHGYSRHNKNSRLGSQAWAAMAWERSVDSLKVSQGMANLYGTNLFDQMHLSVHHEGDSSQWNVTSIYTHERNTELIRFGLRVDNERNIHRLSMCETKIYLAPEQKSACWLAEGREIKVISLRSRQRAFSIHTWLSILKGIQSSAI